MLGRLQHGVGPAARGDRVVPPCARAEPGAPDALLDLAQALMIVGENDEAAELLGRLLASHRTACRAICPSAIWRRSAGGCTRRWRPIERARALDPGNPDILVELGDCYQPTRRRGARRERRSVEGGAEQERRRVPNPAPRSPPRRSGRVSIRLREAPQGRSRAERRQACGSPEGARCPTGASQPPSRHLSRPPSRPANHRPSHPPGGGAPAGPRRERR